MFDVVFGGVVGVWFGRFFGCVMEKEIWKLGVRDVNILYVVLLVSLVWCCFIFGWYVVVGLVCGLLVRVYVGDLCCLLRYNDARWFFNLASF